MYIYIYMYMYICISDTVYRVIAIGKELSKKIAESLIKADKIGDEMHLPVVKGLSYKRKSRRFDPNKKVNLGLGLRKTEKIRKAVLIMKEYRQTFRVMLGGKVKLEVAFRYPVTSVSLSSAFLDSSLRQYSKHHFRNYLNYISKACESTFLNEARWIIDTMSVIRAIKVKETYKEWLKTVIKFTLPSSSLKALSIEYVNNMYRGTGAKNCSRDERGRCEIRVHLQNLAFFDNIKNKQHLFSLFVIYLCADNFVGPSPLAILVKNENETLKTSFEWKHKEANARMIFHVLQQKTNVLVCSKDTDVLVLIAFFYALNKINEK